MTPDGRYEDLEKCSEFNWVKFLTSTLEPENVDRLVWGITGKSPSESVEAATTNNSLASVPLATDQPADAGKPGRSARVVFGLHGIRTHAGWNRAFHEIAADDAWQVRTDRWNFGRFSLLRFLAPWARAAKVRWFHAAYRDEINDRHVLLDKGESPSIVAHSFGTYILGNALLKYDWLRFNKVLLCGSILPLDFPWKDLIERGQVQAIRNEYGVEDIWCRCVRWFVAGTGPSGVRGCASVHDRLEQEEFEYTHSEYFDKGHMEAKWLPFLDRSVTRIPTKTIKVKRRRPSKPWALYAILYPILFSLLSATVYLGVLWVRHIVQGGSVSSAQVAVELVDATFQSLEDNEADSRAPRLDLKLSNPNDRLVFVKRVEIEVHKIWNLRSIPSLPEKFVEPTHIYVQKLPSGGAPFNRSLSVSQEIEARKSDRFFVQFQGESEDDDSRTIYRH